MFSITRLDPSSQGFVTSLTQSNNSRSLAASIAVARVLSTKIDVPAQKVDDIVQHYRLTCQIYIEQKLYLLNELTVLDTNTIKDLVISFYKLRYQQAKPNAYVFSFKKDTAIADFFDVSRFINEQVLTCITENCGQICVFMNEFNKVLNQLEEKEENVPQ